MLLVGSLYVWWWYEVVGSEEMVVEDLEEMEVEEGKVEKCSDGG